MQIIEISVHAERTIPNPYVQFANLKPGLTIRATLEPGDDPDIACQRLQAKAEALIEMHERVLLGTLRAAVNGAEGSFEERLREEQQKVHHAQDKGVRPKRR